MAWEVDRLPPWKLRLRSFAPVPLRLALGFGLLYHGYPKLFTAQGNEAIAGTLSLFGFPAPGLTAYLLGAFEFFGGILLMLGVIVRFIALLGTVEMAIAGALVHWPNGFDFMNITGMSPAGEMQYGPPGYEVNLLYLAGFLSLLLSGGGALSLPSVREDRTPRHEVDYDDTAPQPEATVPQDSTPIVG